MRCYHEAPTPIFVGTIPNKVVGMPPVMITLGMSPEVFPDRFCRHHPVLAAGALPSVRGAAMPMPAHTDNGVRN